KKKYHVAAYFGQYDLFQKGDEALRRPQMLIGRPPCFGIRLESSAAFNLVDDIYKPTFKICLTAEQLQIDDGCGDVLALQPRNRMHHKTGLTHLARGQDQTKLVSFQRGE